jgi:hypothetical protein
LTILCLALSCTSYSSEVESDGIFTANQVWLTQPKSAATDKYIQTILPALSYLLLIRVVLSQFWSSLLNVHGLSMLSL